MSRRTLAISLFSLAFVGLFGSSASAIGAGTKAPEIGLVDRAGKSVTIASLKGKVVLVDFWATWCAPCKKVLPVLDGLYRKYRAQDFVIVGVSADNKEENIANFLRRTPLSFTVVQDAGGAVASRYALVKMPSSYLVDRKGLVRHVHDGYGAGDAAAIEAEIKALLAAH